MRHTLGTGTSQLNCLQVDNLKGLPTTRALTNEPAIYLYHSSSPSTDLSISNYSVANCRDGLTLKGEDLYAVVVLVGDNEVVAAVAADRGRLVELAVPLALCAELGVKGPVRPEQLDPIVGPVRHNNQAVLHTGRQSDYHKVAIQSGSRFSPEPEPLHGQVVTILIC